MTYEIVAPIWGALRDRFQAKVAKLSEADLDIKLGETKVADLLYHTAEVEYMFSGWFFDKPFEEELVRPTNLAGYVQLLQEANDYVVEAMQALPEDSWNDVRESRFGNATPLEAVGRLMNHAGIHSGQITYIQKYGAVEDEG